MSLDNSGDLLEDNWKPVGFPARIYQWLFRCVNLLPNQVTVFKWLCLYTVT